MSDREAEDGQNTRLIRALIWAGIGLAPVAALVVLLGGGEGPTRFGVLLIAVCVVLLGASLLIRNDPVLLRMEVEDRVSAELDALRSELRSEFAAAAARAAAASQAAQAPAAARVASAPAASRAVPVPPAMGAARPGNAQVRSAAGPVRAAAVPVREPGQSTGGRAAVAAAVVVRPVSGRPTGERAVAPQPEPEYRPDSDRAYDDRAYDDRAYDQAHEGYPRDDFGYEPDAHFGSGSDAEFKPDRGADLGYAPELDYVPDPGYSPEFDHGPEPGRAPQRGYAPEPSRASQRGYPPEADHSREAGHQTPYESASGGSPGRRVASAPGWPDSRLTPSGRTVASASASVGAVAVTRGPTGGAPVPRQPTEPRQPTAPRQPPIPGPRGRGAASVPPPTAPVFRQPAVQAPRAPGSVGPRRVDDQGGRRRADVTAVDLGYTGRRSRSSHSADDFDHGSGIDGHAADPSAEQYDWRGRENTGGW